MEKTIWKYKIEPGGNIIKMPSASEILSAQMQEGTPYIWALVNPGNPLTEVCLEVYGTGHSIPYDVGIIRKFIGTFQMYSGSLVFHLFEKITQEK